MTANPMLYGSSRMKTVLGMLALALSIQSADVGYIVGLYSQKDRPGVGETLSLRVDGKQVAKLRFPTYYRVAVPPGAYEITIGSSEKQILCHVIAGEFCYVRARTKADGKQVEVDLISPEQAWRELPKTYPIESGQVLMKSWR